MDSDVLIKADHVSKKFCRTLKRSLWYGVNDMANEVLGRNRDGAPLRKDEFWAVNDVSFELRRGECLGLIGRNGAGKTTLLKMLNGLIKPDHGRITMRGRVGALIALGAGFNPILTGRENIYVNASVLGLSRKEVDAEFGNIVDFAGVHDFIDTPVQNYSSGMHVRLGFAVATTLTPDILIIDEVLAVGDAAFRARCYARMAELKSSSAIILVSHDMSAISHICTKALLLHNGRLEYCGEPRQTVQLYNRLNRHAGPTNGVRTTAECITSLDLIFPEHVTYDDPLHGTLSLSSSDHLPSCNLKATLTTAEGISLFEFNTKVANNAFDIVPGNNVIRFAFGRANLRPGDYLLSVFVYDSTSLNPVVYLYRTTRCRVDGPGAYEGLLIFS